MFLIETYQGADNAQLRYGRLVKPEQPGGKSTGRAMLFVPGLGGSVKGALEFLEHMLTGFDAIYGPDLRGFGLNPVDEPLTSINSVMADLERFQQDVIRPAGHRELVLCGLSLGGVLSTLLAARYPERFSRLILLAPAFKPHPKSFSLTYTLRTMLAHVLQGPRARTGLPYDMGALTRNEAVLNDPQYLEHPPLELSPGYLLGARSLCGQARREIATLRVPTLMVIPGQDIVCDPQAMRAACARIPKATPSLCREYPEFYHDVLFEEGWERMAQEILSWSTSSDSAATSLSSI